MKETKAVHINDTSTRVLKSACRLFAEKGFRDTTTQDICRTAKANIASMNYYFRNKANLYHEVWTYAQSLDEKAHSADSDNGTNAELWLKNFIQRRVEAIFDNSPAGYLCRIVRREMADPTPMTGDLYAEFLLPYRIRIENAVKEILGPKATPLHILSCSVNVLSLYVFLNIGRVENNRFITKKKLTQRDMNTIAKQTAEFALEGLHGMRSKIEKETP